MYSFIAFDVVLPFWLLLLQLVQEEMSILEEKFGAKKKANEEEEIKDVETKTILHSKQL